MLLTFSDQLIKYGMWPVSVLIFCLIVVIVFRKRIGPIFDKVGPAIDRLKRAGPLELAAPPSQQPIDVRAKSPEKTFHPLENPLLKERETAIRRDIEALFPTDMTGRVDSLVTHLAATSWC